MEYRKFGEKLFIRLDPGDEIISSLTAVCESEGVRTAQIQGIGGCRSAAVGVFDLDTKKYHRQQVDAMLELISLDGNVTVNDGKADGKPFMHIHASYAYHDENGEAKILAGHLLESVIGLTGEIVITPADGSITRRYDPELGIRVWDFS